MFKPASCLWFCLTFSQSLSPLTCPAQTDPSLCLFQKLSSEWETLPTVRELINVKKRQPQSRHIYLCMSCVLMYTHVHICTHHVIVWGGQGLGMVCSVFFFCFYTLLFEIVSLAEPRVHWFCHTSWPASLWALPATTHPLLGLRVCTTVPGFYVDAGDLNLGPHICAASTLTSEPSLQLYLFDSVIIVLRSPLKNFTRLWL